MKNLYQLMIIASFTVIALTACGGEDEYHFHSHTHIDIPSDEDAGSDSRADAGYTDPDADLKEDTGVENDEGIDPDTGRDSGTDAGVDTGPDAGEDADDNTPALSLSLASASPSGAGVPTLGEVLRLNASADSRGDVVIEKIMFLVETRDNDFGTDPESWSKCSASYIKGWNRGSKWKLYVDGVYFHSFAMRFFNALGERCTTGEQLIWIEMDFTIRTNGPLEVKADETVTISLYADTTGANSAHGDSIRVGVPTEHAVDNVFAPDEYHVIQWRGVNADDSNDGSSIDNLPIWGGMITY